MTKKIFLILFLIIFLSLIFLSPLFTYADNISQVNSSSDSVFFPDIKDVNKHLLTIAFSEYNGVIQRKESNKSITFGLFGAYSNDDIVLLQDFIKKFDEISQTLQVNKNIKKETEADLWINILPEKALSALPDEQMDITVREGLFGQILYRVNLSNQVYINADLPPNERLHNIRRAILFWLGITGSATDKSSFFYPANNDQLNLTLTDWKALTSLYNPSLRSGLTVSETKNRLYTT